MKAPHHGTPLIDSDSDCAQQSRRLIAPKAYENGSN
jgi:hypothetical protein